MYLLDTNICVALLNGNRQVEQQFSREFPQCYTSAEEFGKIQAELRQLARPTGVMDSLIAAVARSRGSIVVTNNIRDFENIPGLRLEDWIA